VLLPAIVGQRRRVSRPFEPDPPLRPQDVTTRVVAWEDAAQAFVEPAVKLIVRRD
jgi:hypothetical protein